MNDEEIPYLLKSPRKRWSYNALCVEGTYIRQGGMRWVLHSWSTKPDVTHWTSQYLTLSDHSSEPFSPLKVPHPYVTVAQGKMNISPSFLIDSSFLVLFSTLSVQGTRQSAAVFTRVPRCSQKRHGAHQITTVFTRALLGPHFPQGNFPLSL